MKKYLLILSVFFISISGFTAPKLRIYVDRSTGLYPFDYLLNSGGYHDINQLGNFSIYSRYFTCTGNLSSNSVTIFTASIFGYTASFPQTLFTSCNIELRYSTDTLPENIIMLHLELDLSAPIYEGVNPLVIDSFSNKSCDIDISQFSNSPTSFSFTSFPYPMTFDSLTGKGSFIPPVTSTFLSYSGTFYATSINGISELIPFTVNVHVLTQSMLYHIICQSFWFICGLLTVLLFTFVFKL